MAGTGNDYIGKVSVTRSNRTCQTWSTLKPNKTKFANETEYITSTTETINTTKITRHKVRYHKVDPEFQNGSLYADLSAEAALNFCRNPSRSIAG